MSVKEKIAPLFLFFSAFLWSLSGIFTKSTAWNGVCLSTLRGIIAFFIILYIVRGRKIHLTKLKALTAVCYFAQGLLFICANKFTTSANATVLQNMSPLYIILFNAMIVHKLPTKREIRICVILFLGITLAFAGNMGGGGILGNCLAMLSALFYAGVFFLSKQSDADSVESLFFGNACYFLLLPYLFRNSVVWETSFSEWILLFAFATLTGACAWLCFAYGICHTSALQASFITMAEPVMAPIWTFLVLHEMVSPISFIGCVIVVGTLLFYNISLARSSS